MLLLTAALAMFALPSLAFVAAPAGLVALAYHLAYLLRFDGDVPALYSDLFERTIGFVIVGSILVFALFGLYRHWMRYASQRDYLQIAQACVTATLAFVAYVASLGGRNPRWDKTEHIVHPALAAPHREAA